MDDSRHELYPDPEESLKDSGRLRKVATLLTFIFVSVAFGGAINATEASGIRNFELGMVGMSGSLALLYVNKKDDERASQIIENRQQSNEQ